MRKVLAAALAAVGTGLLVAGAGIAFSTGRYTDGREAGALVFVAGMVLVALSPVAWPMQRRKD